MDVRMPDGTLVRNVPDNVTQEDLLARYDAFKSDKRGNIINTDVPTVVGTTANPPVVEEPKRTMMDRVKALYEVPLTVASGAIAGPVSSAYGVYKSATSPEFGTAQGTQVGQQAANEMARRMTYQPTSPVSQEILQDVGQMAEAAKLPPIIPTTGMLPSYARMANASQPVVREAATQAVPRMTEMLRKKPESTMSGVGSALTPEDTMRMQMAQQLRVPVPLSKGQATRDLAQQQFEIETAKNYPETVGKPLIKAQADRNDAILQNFDAFVDATGKQTFGLEPTGRVIVSALNKEAEKARKKIGETYKLAREQGETEQPVSYAPLRTFIEEQTPTVRAKIAPVLDVVNEQLAKNDPKGTGQISINAIEDVYTLINKMYEPNTPNATYGRDMRNIINTITEGQGGKMYQEARRLRQDYAKNFENIGAVDRLLRTKPNSSDRLVAFEDVFQKSIINGSLDDVRNLGFALKKSGPQGQQAFKELQGQAIEYLKDKVTQSIDTDIYGNPVVSPAKFKSAVRELDQDGKLDYLFGKKGAQEIRDLMETTTLVNAPLKGAANYSNTSSAIMRALDLINRSPISRIPVVGNLADYSFQKAQESVLKKKVKESINYSPSKMAEELKKGSKK
jgi:hypothetical protein